MAIQGSNMAQAEFGQSQTALSRWDDEGGACPEAVHVDAPETMNGAVEQLRIRVIALEHLITALLAEGSDHQLEVARGLAEAIAPEDGANQHPLTIMAATQMAETVRRAADLRTVHSA